MKYLARGYEQHWSDEAVVTVLIPASDREEWTSLNRDFWWSFEPVPNLWDRLTRAARSRTFGRVLGAVLVMAGLLAVMGLAGAIEGGFR